VAGAKLAGNGWPAPFIVYGLIGLAFCVLIALVIPKAFTERREDAGDVRRPVDVGHVPAGLCNRNTVLLAVTAVVVGMSMYGYIGLYPTFLSTQLHWSGGQAALAASMFGLGALLGIPAGWLGDRVDQRYLMIVTLLAGSLVGYLLFNGPTGAVAQYGLSFAEGAIASGFLFVNIYSAIQRAVRPQLIGRASGLYVSSFYVPAAFAGYLFSALVGATGWGGAAIWQLTVLPLVGVVALLFVDVGRFADARARTAS
jgi:sugar phosphate permease